MTVASEITKLQTNLSNSYTACQGKGATLPTKQNFDNLPATIESITGGGGEAEYKKLYGMDISDLIPEPNSSGAIVIPTTASVIQSFDGVKSVPEYCFNYKFRYLTNIKEAHYPDLKTIETYGLSSAYENCTGLTKITFDALEEITGNVLQRVCSGCTNLTTAELPMLKRITSTSGMQYAFNGCNLTSFIFSELEEATGLSYAFQNNKSLTYLGFPKLREIRSSSSGMSNMVNGCTALEEVDFPELESIQTYMGASSMFTSSSVKVVRFTKLNDVGRSGCSSMFSSCKTIEHVYFPALTTSSFGSTHIDQFNGMMSSTGTTVTHTLHFPANMEATISTLRGYPLFGGSDGYVVLAFDLPATS